MFSIDKSKLEDAILVTLTIAMCIQRITMAGSSILLGVSIAMFLFYVYRFREQVWETCKGRSVKFYVFMHILFMCSLIPSLFGTDRLGVSIREFFNLGLYHVLPFIIVMAIDLDEKKITRMLMAFLIIEAIESSVAMYKTITEYEGPGTRGDGFGPGGLFLPGMLSYAIPLCGMLFVEQGFNKQLRNCALIAFPFFVGGVWAANSRAGTLIFLLDVFILVGVYVFNGGNVWAKIGSALAVLAVCGGILICHWDRVRTSSDFSINEGSNYGRVLLWRASLNMMKDHPLTGIGLGNWKRIYKQKYKPQEAKDKWYYDKLAHAHSSYMQIGGQAGWSGFVGLIVFHLGVLGYSLLQWLRKKDVCAGIVFLMWLGEGIFGLIQPVFVESVSSKFIMWLSALILVYGQTVSDDESK